MKTTRHLRTKCFRNGGFTLVEVLVAMVLLGVSVASVYTAIACGFRWVQASRINLRANQVMMEKMEVIRLLTWSQINSNGFVPTTFSAPYIPGDQKGLVYSGTITIAPVTNLSSTYAPYLRAVSVKLNSPSGTPARTWELTSYYGRYGLHNYIISK